MKENKQVNEKIQKERDKETDGNGARERVTMRKSTTAIEAEQPQSKWNPVLEPTHPSVGEGGGGGGCAWPSRAGRPIG